MRSLQVIGITPALLAFVLLFSSCTKEEMVTPAGVQPVAITKGLMTEGHGTPGDPSSLNGRDTEDPSSGEGDSISDDGDDLSGTERKKKR